MEGYMLFVISAVLLVAAGMLIISSDRYFSGRSILGFSCAIIGGFFFPTNHRAFAFFFLGGILIIIYKILHVFVTMRRRTLARKKFLRKPRDQKTPRAVLF